MPSYRELVDLDRIAKTRAICRDLPQACSDFLSSIALTSGTFTRLAYAIDLRTFFHFLSTERVAFSDTPVRHLSDRDLDRLTPADLIAYMDYLTFYYKTEEAEENPDALPTAIVNHERAIKRKLCAVRSFYDYLFRSKRITANVTTLVDLPKIHDKPIIRLNENEVKRLLYIAETGENLTEGQMRFHHLTARRDYAMLMLFLGTGIRVSECVGINIPDVDLEENAFLVTRKGGNQVILYFPPEVATALAAYMNERSQIEALPGHEDALFLNIQKKRITQRAVEKMVKKYAATAAPLKAKISPHKLRSTFATNLYQASGDIYLVAETLGHSSVDTTRRHYADMTDERRRMASQMVELPEPIGIAAEAPAEPPRKRKTKKAAAATEPPAEITPDAADPDEVPLEASSKASAEAPAAPRRRRRGTAGDATPSAE